MSNQKIRSLVVTGDVVTINKLIQVEDEHGNPAYDVNGDPITQWIIPPEVATFSLNATIDYKLDLHLPLLPVIPESQSRVLVHKILNKGIVRKIPPSTFQCTESSRWAKNSEGTTYNIANNVWLSQEVWNEFDLRNLESVYRRDQWYNVSNIPIGDYYNITVPGKYFFVATTDEWGIGQDEFNVPLSKFKLTLAPDYDPNNSISRITIQLDDRYGGDIGRGTYTDNYPWRVYGDEPVPYVDLTSDMVWYSGYGGNDSRTVPLPTDYTVQGCFAYVVIDVLSPITILGMQWA